MSPGRYAIVWQLARCGDWTWRQREYMARIALRLKPNAKVPQQVWDRICEISDLLDQRKDSQADALIRQLVDGSDNALVQD